MKRYWTDEELATLREVYATMPPGQSRKAELLQRLPGRTVNAIKNQIVSLGLARTATQEKNRNKGQGLAGRVYATLAQHGPLSVAGLAEFMLLPVPAVSSAIAHLTSKRSVIYDSGRRPRQWRVRLTPGPARHTPPRRVDWGVGITEEDHEWMRRYREQRERRLAQMEQRPCS